MIEKYMDTILKIKLFDGINREELIGMMPCLNPTILTYSKGEYIKMTGDKVENFGVILEGKVTVSKENEGGNTLIIAHLETLDLFGEIIAFAMAEEWNVTVTAIEPTTVLFLPKERLVSQCGHVCRWHKQLIQNMLTILSQKAMQLNKKVEYVSLKSISSKLAKYILEQHHIAGEKTFTIPLNRNQLADFLNVSRPSMSREMSKMRDKGLIDFHLSTIRVTDEAGLKKIVQNK
jgi:CRP-like cAMP-binding protein